MFKKFLSYFLSIIFYLLFGIAIVVFDLIQRVLLAVFGYEAHRKSVALLNLILVRLHHLLGIRYDIELPENLPIGKPVIIVANHQSMWDIPPIIWFLRKLHPKFISKKELGKGIPSISYNLRKGGSVLIDRNKPEQATEEILKISQYISKHNRSVVIFPEGTRSKTSEPKPFKKKGLFILFENTPNAYVLPISISNSWRLQRYGLFPIPIGTQFKFKVHPALKVDDFSKEELLEMVENKIKEAIE